MKKMNDDDILSDTLYVCGLPDVDQEEIDETFSAFGSVESIKFLDPDKKTAFVKFVSSHEAEDAHKYSKGLLINDTLVKVTWGRRSHLSPQPIKQQVSTSTSTSVSYSSSSYSSSLSTSSSSSSSSSYSRHSHHDYHYHSSSSSTRSHSKSHHYHHSSHSKDRDHSEHRNEYTKESNEKEKENSSKSIPPSQQQYQPQPQQLQQNELFPNPLLQNIPLRPDQEDQLSQFIEKLDGSMDSIKGFSSWIVLNTVSEFDVGSVVSEIVSGIQKTNHSKKLFMLFVLTDVFCQKILTRRSPLELDPFSAAILKHIPTIFSDIAKSATQDEKDKISAIIALWKKREVYFPVFIDTLQEFITKANQIPNNPHSEENDPTPGEFATMHMLSEAKYGQAPIYYTPFNLSVFKNVDTAPVECSDEEIAALYEHFKKRIKTELEVMDKPLEERMATSFVDGKEAEEGPEDDYDPADGYSSLDSDDFSDSDYELETKKIKL